MLKVKNESSDSAILSIAHLLYRHIVHELCFTARFFFSFAYCTQKPRRKATNTSCFFLRCKYHLLPIKFLTFSLNVHVNATCPLWQPRIFTQYSIAFSSKYEKSPTAIMHKTIELPLWCMIYKLLSGNSFTGKSFLLFYFFLD